MFYVKINPTDETTVKIELTDENIFNICPRCKCECAVDRAAVFRGGEGDLFSTQTFCHKCSEEIKAERGMPL